MNGDHQSRNRDQGGRYPQKLSDDEVVEVRAAEGENIRVEPIHRFRLETIRDGKAEGRFEATGTVPYFLEHLKSRGFPLEGKLFAAGPLDMGAKR